ncbi:MAG: MBL fold metallo-hydrolase [bacterium]
MKKLYTLIFLVLFALTAGFALVQQDFSKVEVKATKVAGSIYMLKGSGGNIGVSVGKDGVLMVDDQFAPLADKIKTAIQEVGGDVPRFLLNTHWHGDHTGGNEVFSADATIISHTNVRQRLMTEQKRGERVMPAKPEAAWPIITFDNSLTVHFNGEDIQALHYPHGHTDGDAVIFFKGSNVVHMGDHFFSGLFPFVDLDSGGNLKGYIQNVENIIKVLPEDVKIIPGHGELSNLEDLKAFHRMLVETTEIVKERMDEGTSLAEIKANGLPEKWKSYDWRFISTDRWIETIHRSLTEEMSKK